MSEYWKSTPKYYCKHCKTFVVDTPVSKKNHDASPKHQGALKRFLRDLHRTTEKEASAAASAKREVARLNALVSGGPSSSSTSAAGLPPPTFKPPPPQRPVTEEERKRQLKELEALGVALPDEARRELAMVGEWAEVEVHGDAPSALDEKEIEKEKVRRELKRKYEEEEKERKWNAMDEDEREMRGFSIQTKTYPPKSGGALAGGFKPMVFKGKGKAKAEDPPAAAEKEEKEVKKEEDADTDTDTPATKPDPDVAQVKMEEEDVGAESTTITTTVKTEVGEPTEVKKDDADDGIVFKKRKVRNIRKKT